MNQSQWTSIHFDYGGHYLENGHEFQWIPREAHKYSLLITEPFEETTYAQLVGRICRKIRVDEATTKLKLTYTRLVADGEMPTLILDDEDALVYIMGCKNDLCSVLHVELMEGVSQNQISDKRLREDRASRVDVRNEDMTSDARDNPSDGRISLNTQSEPNLLLEYGTGIEEEDDYEGRYDMCDIVEITPNAEGNEVVNHEWDDGIDMTVGQEFESKRAVQDLIERAVHRNCFAVATIKSTTTLYVLKCCDAGCKWSLRVAKLKNSERFSVRTYRKMHTCSRVATSTSATKRKGTPRLVASVLHEDYPGQFDTLNPKSIIGLVQGRLGVNVSYATAWRGRKQAASDVRGSPEESFMRLPSYLHMLKKMNRGTVTYVECDEQERFKYLFIALGACIEGFSAMRKVIIVDGTHLKTDYGGVLIFALAQDPDRHHYPIAFGVVDGEKDASWRWFLTKLKISVPDHPEIVFISDRNQSIIKTIGEVYPQAKHGYCIYHLAQNVKSHVSGVNKEEVARKFRECAQVYTEAEFIPLYDAFQKKYPKAVEYLEDSTTENKWARCYFPGERYNIDTTNCVESINNVFRKARSYSLLPMLDEIVGKILEWFNKYRKMAADVPLTQKLVPRVAMEMHTRCQEASLLRVQELNSFLLEYSVFGRDGNRYLVDLRRKSCSCRHFDIDRYPCEHAIAAAVAYANTGNQLDLHELCSKYYLMEQWSLAYYMTIYPVPSLPDWDVPHDIIDERVQPPSFTRRAGRKQTTRYPSVGESRRKSRSSCNSSSF